MIRLSRDGSDPPGITLASKLHASCPGYHPLRFPPTHPSSTRPIPRGSRHQSHCSKLTLAPHSSASPSSFSSCRCSLIIKHELDVRIAQICGQYFAVGGDPIPSFVAMQDLTSELVVPVNLRRGHTVVGFRQGPYHLLEWPFPTNTLSIFSFSLTG